MGKDEYVRPQYEVLEEEIEDNYQPTQEELTEYAEWLGMELPRDKDLLWIAHEGLTKPLAKEWKPCRTEVDEIYYFNFETGESQWDHPCDEFHRNLLKAELQRLGRPVARKQQMYCATEASASSQSNIQDHRRDHQDEDTHEEEGESEAVAPPPKPSEVHPSKAGIKTGKTVLDRSWNSPSNLDTGTEQQMDDTAGSQTGRISDIRDEQAEVGASSATWKSKKGIKEAGGLSSGSKEEEDREMALRRAQMMETVKREIEEEERVVLQEARRAMQERVDVVIKKEEKGLLADKRVKMLDVVAKRIESETETEVGRRRRNLKMELDDEIEAERGQILEEKRAKMCDDVTKQIQEEHEAEVAQRRRKVQSQKIQTKVDQEDPETMGTGQVKEISKPQEEDQSDYGGEDLLRLNLQLDEKQQESDDQLLNLVLDSFGGRLQDSRNHILHSDLYSVRGSERREFARCVKEKLKLEELQLYDELREKMVIRVREAISAAEGPIFEEEHRLAKIRLRNRVNEHYKKPMQDAEFQLLQEKESLLSGKREGMQSRLGSFRAFQIPVASSFDGSTASKRWRGEQDEEKSVDIEPIWSNTEHSHRIQVDIVGNAEDIWSRRYLDGSFCNLGSSFGSDNSTLLSTRWNVRSEEEKNVKVENMWSQNRSQASRLATESLETRDASFEVTPDLKSWKTEMEESFKDLIEQLKKELRKELPSLRGGKEVAYHPSAEGQEPSRVLDLPQALPSSIGGWSEVGKEIRDLFQHCRNELEDRFHTLKVEVKDELKVLLPHKDVITEILRRPEQESQSKLMLYRNGNRGHHVVSSHGKMNNVDAADRLDFTQVDDFSVHVRLEAKKCELSVVDQWISEADAPIESKFTHDLPHQVKGPKTYRKEKTPEEVQQFLLGKSEEKLQLNSLRFANEYNWTRMQRCSGLDYLGQRERSNLQTKRLTRWMQKHMKWVMQCIASGWRRADMICLKCCLAIRQTVRRLDSFRAIVVSRIQKSRRECKMGQCKRAEHFHADFDSETSSWHRRRRDRSPTIDPRKRQKDFEGWVAPKEPDHMEPRTTRSITPLHYLAPQIPSDFRLALGCQKNDGKMRWLYSDSELEELRDLWNMDAGYASPAAKLKQSNQYKGQVQASGKWTPDISATKAVDSSFSQLTEDTNFTSNKTQTDSRHSRNGVSSTSTKKLCQLDMLELEDAIATFRHSREILNIEGSSVEQGRKLNIEHQGTRKVVMVQAVGVDEGMDNKGYKTELLQLPSHPLNSKMTPEIEEVEERAPTFITLEFATTGGDGFARQGTQIGSSNRYHCQPTHTRSHRGVSQTVWRI